MKTEQMASSPDVADFPPELYAKPLALVGLTGLDALNNAVHRAIWDAFSNNRRPDRAPVQFKLLSASHEFPPMKPKRNSYDWYIPKGILKRNWMNKHLNELPAVVVVFYELDWDDPHWNEKRIECSSRVQSMRVALDGRNTRLAVVLIQQTVSLPTGEDVLAAERAAALCTSCELNPKSLFVLPHEDHLHGYTIRLENAFYDLAQAYYHHEARNVKGHREQLNKTTHQYLFVRHQFKVGFLNELKQDNHTAQKHYSQAYSNLLEVRVVDTNALEVKTVAGFINYKLCKIMFQQNLPRDAINQFRKHTELFRSCLGAKDLAFEHHAWMSKQFCAFGEIFEEAIRLGLPALQTQHPGFYYQQAAQHATDRKVSCEELCKHVETYPEPDPLSGESSLEFYGQRPWRPGKLSAEPPDPSKEKQGVQALQYREKNTVNHSMLIIGLLSSAISQFKTYRCPKMRRQLVVQMADEYYSSQDYGKALTLLSHMLWDYRSEKWWLLLTNILTRALNCAYLSANVQDYITLSLEALAATTQLPLPEKIRIHNNLEKLLKKLPPDPEPNVTPEEGLRAKDLWSKASRAELLTVTVEMNSITSCIESRARFTKSKYQADENVVIEVFIRSCCPQPLQFSKLSVTVNNPSYSSEFAVCDEGPSLLFTCGEVKRFACKFLPPDGGRDLQIGSLLLQLGTERCTILRFTGSGNDGGTACDAVCPELQHFRPSPVSMPDFDNIRSLTSAVIVPRDSKLDVTVIHDEPALLGEWYPIKIVVNNTEEQKLNVVGIDVMLQTSTDDASIEQATQMCDNVAGELLSLPIHFELRNMEKGATEEKVLYMRGHRTGHRNFTINASYSLTLFRDSTPVENSCLKEVSLTLPIVKPFDVNAKFFSMKFEPVTKTFAKEPFLIMPHVNCSSPCPLEIVDSSLELSQQASSVDATMKSQLRSVCLKDGEIGAEAYCVCINQAAEQPVALGVYTLQWKRKGSNSQVTSSSIMMPTIRVEASPLAVEMRLPAHGWVRTPMAVSYLIRNHTELLLELDLSMEASEAFMFAGHKQLQLRILPDSIRTLDYNLYPLLSGLVALPRLKLTPVERSDSPVHQSLLSELLERSLPSHVYVMPQAKKAATSVAVAS
ncbi:trafficking protein particle complex subunit 11 isoform X1 [Schistocerca serialis cubense]|uniref:trafficking protein particle complex subunit 11 isoform X1 n=1 Tax=Schistocerca serialis cubense TaxID=2023355 RepID=UPI00214EF0A0|nr:trafficking protein particle complex subunit 11 isoform X1 [Schistocerca serialis cubense]